MPATRNDGVLSEDYVADPDRCAEVRWRSPAGTPTGRHAITPKLAHQCKMPALWAVPWDASKRRYEMRQAPIEGQPSYCRRHARAVRDRANAARTAAAIEA